MEAKISFEDIKSMRTALADALRKGHASGRVRKEKFIVYWNKKPRAGNNLTAYELMMGFSRFEKAMLNGKASGMYFTIESADHRRAEYEDEPMD